MRASTSQLEEQTTISSTPEAASSVRLRNKARENSPCPISTIVSRLPLEAARRTASTAPPIVVEDAMKPAVRVVGKALGWRSS